jgi:hypothetical protein
VFLSSRRAKIFRRQEHLRVVGNPVRASLNIGDRAAAA